MISTPNRKSLWPLIEWALDKFKVVPNLAEEQHEYLYSGKELQQAGEASGFNLQKKNTLNTFAPWVALLNWKLALGIHKLEMRLFKRYGAILLYTFVKPK